MTIAGNFLSELWANADSDALSVELRKLARVTNGDGRAKTITAGSKFFAIGSDEIADVLPTPDESHISCATAGATTAPPDPSNHKAMHDSDVTHLAAAWIDIDLVHSRAKNDPEFAVQITPDVLFEPVQNVTKALKALPFPPSTIIFTGGGVHAYWRFAELAGLSEIELVRRLNERLADICSGDKSVVNPARIMRLPGTFNNKYGTSAAQVATLDATWGDYDLGDLIDQATEYRRNDVAQAAIAARDAINQAIGFEPDDMGNMTLTLPATRNGAGPTVGSGFSLERIDGPSGERVNRAALLWEMKHGDQWDNPAQQFASSYARTTAVEDICDMVVEHAMLPGYTEVETRADITRKVVDFCKSQGIEPIWRKDQAQQVDYQSWRDRFALVAPAGEFYEYATGSTYKLQNWQTAFKYLKNVSPVENNGKPVEYTKKWLDDHDATRVQHYDIEPGGPQIIQHGLAVNIWRPSVFDLLVDNGDPDGKGVPEFKQLVMSLCSDRQDIANQLMGWIGYGLTHQNKRMAWAPMLISEHGGTGKSSLMATVAALYGSHLQVEVPKVEQLIDGFIGDKIWNRTFVAVHETADTSFGNWGAFEALKTQITEKNPQLDIKYRQPVAVTNYRRFMFASNHLTGLPVGPHERRIMPIVLNGKGALTDEFFDLYRGWIDNDDRNVLGNIAAYLAKYHGDTMPPRAPQADSATTQQAMVTDWADELDQYMRNKYPDGVQLLKKDVVAFACRYDDKKVSATQAGKVMERLGWDKDGREPKRPGQVRRRTFILNESEFIDHDTLPLFVDTGKWPIY